MRLINIPHKATWRWLLRCYLSFTTNVNVVTQISFQGLTEISCAEEVLTREGSRVAGEGRQVGVVGSGGGVVERGKLEERRIRIKAQKEKWDYAIFLKYQTFMVPVYYQVIYRLL